jgi:hypothetical protein
MEELGALAAIALVSALVLAVVDVAGFLMGFGWGHFSRKWRAKRSSKVEQHD